MFKRFLYIFLFLLAGVAAFAQQYPVQGSLAIASPYPANLSDYANSNIQNVVLNLTLTDLNMANKRVRLKVFIQTQNATIAQSIDNVSGEPLIMLDGGIPQRFTNAELAHYFRLENLQGINPDGYARSLPEGVYTISFEVYDYFTGNKLSGRIGQTFWIIINDPPLLNTPADKSKIADFTSGSRGTGGIIFNWTPRSTQVSNTEYEFTLCELWDATGDAYQQFMSAIPKYQTTVSNSTTLIYTMAQPSLISGYTYAWRVRAKAKAGFEDVGLYRNDGYSNLFTFRYGDPCPAPQSLTLEAKTSDAIAATWDAPVGATTGGIRFKIAYRKYSAAGQWSWAETETSDLFRTISNLEPATEYEIKVGVSCAPPSGELEGVVFTPSQRAITLAAGQISGIECGKEPTIDLSKQTLLMLLKAGDVVMANDFPTTISSVTGTSQGWSGEAWTKVPWLGDTRIHVTYASIKVNSDYKLIDGSFITTYDPTGKNIGDIDKTIDDAVGLYTGGTDVGKVVTGDAATSYTVPYTITPADTVGSTFTANATGGGTITLGNGQALTVSNLPATVQDAAGTVYQADDKGKLTKVGSNSSNAGAMLATANLTVVDASKGTVTFAPTSDMKYAFDAWQKAYDGNSAWSKRYETLPLSGGAKGGSYRVSSKLMVPGEADKVLAIINLNDKKLVADSVRFVNAKGTLFEKKKITDNSYELSLVGGPAGDAQEVYALYPSPQGEGQGVRSYTLGKLMVATYEPKTINLALVPVNGAKLDSTAIAAELKKVYEPLGIDFNLTTKAKFEYEALETASLKVEGSGLLSVYTEQMKALNAAFVAKGEYDKNTIYLFAIDQPESQDGKSIEGVMPRGQQFGYMFVKGKEGDAQGLTAAHEIGHGIFQLQHVFDYSGIKQKAIAPLNVMDYPAGEALSKLQWDLMHDQGLVISVFETDKGAEISKVETKRVCIDNAINLAITKHKYVLGANNKYFILPDGASIKSIVHADLSPNAAKVGAVVSFVLNGNEYTTIYETSSGKFLRYAKNKSDTQTPIDNYTTTVTDYASINIDVKKCTVTVDSKGYPLTTELCNCAGNQDYQTQPARDFISEYVSEKDKDYYASATAIAQTIDLMGDLYEEYNSIVTSQLTASSVSKTKTSLDNFQKNLLNYYKLHKNAPLINNPNCPECPKHPINGDAYWDAAGRNWVFTNNKWKDLSGEFCDGDGCNNDWKKGFTTAQIQLIHNRFCNEEIEKRVNDPLQAKLGGTSEAFYEYMYRMTQFATIAYLKNKWVEDQVGAQKWIPIWGNLVKAQKDASVANGDMTFYTKAAGDLALAAADYIVLEGVYKKLLEEGAITVARNAATEELSILKEYFAQPKVIITGTSMTLASALTQFTGNYYTNGNDFNDALLNVDGFDAIADGLSATMTVNGFKLMQLFNKSSRISVYRTIGNVSKVFLLEFSKVTVDATWRNGIVYKTFFTDEDAFKVFALFTVNMATSYSSEQLTNMFVKWSQSDMTYLYSTFDPERKALAEKIDVIVKSQSFKKLIDQPFSIINKYISNIVETMKINAEIKKSSTIITTQSFENYIKTNEKLPADKTYVNIQKYIIVP